jgi:predicted outer membrane protein
MMDRARLDEAHRFRRISMSPTKVGHRAALWISALLAVVPLVGCASSDVSDFADELRVQGEERGAELASQVELTADSPEADKLLAEITAGIVFALHAAEVEMSVPVIIHADRASVREYAEAMVYEHFAASERLQGVLDEQGMEAVASPLSVLLRVDGTVASVELGTTPPPELSLLYATKQILAHANAHVLVGTLAARIENAALRSHLEELSDAIDAHLFEAVDLARRLVHESPAP